MLKRVLATLAAAGLLHSAAAAEDTVLAVRPEELGKIWTAVRHDKPRPPFHFSYKSNIPCVEVETGIPIPWQRGSRPGFCGLCAAIGYVVESDGRTSSHRLLRTVPELPRLRREELSWFVIDAMHRWRFEPTESNPDRQAAFTFFNYVLVMHEQGVELEEITAAQDRLADACEISTFP